jgi:hypothetical protein
MAVNSASFFLWCVAVGDHTCAHIRIAARSLADGVALINDAERSIILFRLITFAFCMERGRAGGKRPALFPSGTGKALRDYIAMLFAM